MTALTKAGKPRQRVGPGAPVEERLALHSALTGEGCLQWTAAIDDHGYGRVFLDGKLRYAHRVSYMYAVGPIPDGLEVDHLCRNRACLLPEHLEAVTPAVNVRRGESPGAIAQRRDVCLYGHPYADFGAVSKGRRICRLCKTVYAMLWRRTPYAETGRRKLAGETVIDLHAYFANPSSTAEVSALGAALLAEEVA